MVQLRFGACPAVIAVISFFTTNAIAASPGSASYERTVQPFVTKNCFLCHNAKIKTAALNLEQFKSDQDVLANREIWEHVSAKLEAGQMPPPGLPRPPAEEIKAVTAWIEARFAQADKNSQPDPGQVTARRLNRAEYNNTVRDLLAVNLHLADEFPLDDSGYGFDNNGDVLSLSPVLMEKYLTAAEKAAKAAIATDPLPKASLRKIQHLEAQENIKDGDLFVPLDVAIEGDYTFEMKIVGLLDPLMLVFNVDGNTLGSMPLSTIAAVPRIHLFEAHLSRGRHVLTAHLIETFPPKQGDRQMVLGNKLIDLKQLGGLMKKYVDSIEIRGPMNPVAPPEPESYKKVFVCGHEVGHHTADCARLDIANLASRAYRRPVTPEEVSRLVQFVTLTQKRGGTFEQGMRVAVQAILVSPDFLFRIEKDPLVASGQPHRLTDYELASRLSYFLWSSMPDDQLFDAAKRGDLHEIPVLESQVRRMLADPRSRALVQNFAGQWLQTRNLDTMKPDATLFPEFNDDLRSAMKRETEMFFASVIANDRSILDLIDARDTFLNGRLARFYGISGVYGKYFRHVDLGDNPQRGGILTDASVLTVTSYPNRTSPVLRGKWLLENILNAPPPPPPPNVPNLKTEGVGEKVSLRQQLEEHRANAVCASCHSRMDPLGFGLENYDAVGHWRTHDGKIAIDSSGKFPNGESFTGPAEMKKFLLENKDVFTRGFVDAMMTYGLGRGVETYDTPVLRSIADKVAVANYRFSSVVIGIVESVPFQMRRSADAERAVAQTR